MNIIEASLEQRAIYSLSNESKIKNGDSPSFIAESPNVVLRALKAGYELESLLLEERYLNHQNEEESGENNLWASIQEILSLAKQLPIYVGSLDMISSICGFRQSHGFLASFKRKKLPSFEEVIQGKKRIIILEDIQNPTNIGSIFRSGAALGMDSILLSPACSDPLYRRSVRVSMGGVFQIPWTFMEEDSLSKLKENGFAFAAMALAKESITLDDARLNDEDKLAILFGNEQHGLPDSILKLSDYIVKIPMHHGMDSLNVASSSAIAFYQLAKKDCH